MKPTRFRVSACFSVKNEDFWILTLKMSFAPIFMVIFIISHSKYVGIRSFKATGGNLLPEDYPLVVKMLTPTLEIDR